MTQTFPDLFVIGAMKAGTTSFYDIYFNDPNINLTRSKEHNGFVRYDALQQIERSYHSAFRRSSGITCDISPKYSQRHIFPGVAEKIAEANPHAKIIYLIRDPVERLISHIYHDCLRDRIGTSDIHTVLQDIDNSYIKSSLYYYQLEPYLNVFKKEQIMLLDISLLDSNHGVVEQQLRAFLDLPNFVLTTGKSYESSKRYKIFFFDWVHKKFGEGSLTKAYHWFCYFLNVKPKRPKLSAEDIERLNSVFKSDITQLRTHFDVDTRRWKYVQ